MEDLSVLSSTTSSISLGWTEVADAEGAPSTYQVRYAAPPIDWSTATVGCAEILGSGVGARQSCTVGDLEGDKAYQFQIMSSRSGTANAGQHSNIVTGQTATPVAGAVTDLMVEQTTDSSLTLRWTQVDDGMGEPAQYRVKYGHSPLAWSLAAVGCASILPGTAIGSPISCTIQDLPEETSYDVQLMSVRNAEEPQGILSNLVQARTSSAPVVQRQARPGIWIGTDEIAQLPTSGRAWTNLLSVASRTCGLVNLADQEQTTNVCVFAKALVFSRTGDPAYRADVVAAIEQIVASGAYVGRALALGRELGTYVVAADLIALESFDSVLDRAFRAKLRTLRQTPTSGAAANLIACHEERPNNWGAHCGATRAAIAVYLGDQADLARTAQVFKGYLGDRVSYAGFEFGGPENDLSWQCDPTRPVAINPARCVRASGVLDGVMTDDQRRAGAYRWPAPRENYVWEALQGLLAQAVILYRAGYPVWEWEDSALLRAAEWLHGVNGFPAVGDDTWLPHILNRYYGTSFPAAVPTRAGKNFGFTDWTHRACVATWSC